MKITQKLYDRLKENLPQHASNSQAVIEIK